MSLRLLLTRHGQTLDNLDGRLTGWGDVPLTALGERQAARLADFVAAHYRLSAIYASPLVRAWQTASVVGAKVGLTPIVVEELREIHFGDCEGLTDLEFRDRHPLLAQAANVPEDIDFVWPGGECRRDFYLRIRTAFRDIERLNSGRTVLVVTHGGVVAYYLSAVCEGHPGRWRGYLMDNCALAELAVDGASARLVRYNHTAHLD